MLSFFKSNNPSVVIFYIFYLVLFRVCFVFVSVDSSFVLEHREPLSALLFGTLKNISANYQIIGLVLSAVLCFIQALFINGIANDNKILSKKNYLAGALFIIFSSFFKENLLLSPASVALTFVILSTARLFSLIRKEKSYGDVFDVGFLIAVATLFYFPCILFVLFAYIGLATVRAFNYREWIIIMLGFISPFLLVFTFYFWNDKTSVLLPDMANVHANGWLIGLALNVCDKITVGAMAIVTVACLTLLPASLYSSLIQVRKFANILVLLIFLALISAVLEQSIHLSHFILLALPLGIISSMVLMQIKRGLVSEVIHLILILLVLTGQFLPLLNII